MTTTVHIDNEQVLHSGVLIMDDYAVASIEIRLPLGVMITTDVVKIQLECSGDPALKPTVTWANRGDAARVTLTGFQNNLLNVVLPEAVHIGNVEGTAIFLQLCHTRASDKNVVQYVVLHTKVRAS